MNFRCTNSGFANYINGKSAFFSSENEMLDYFAKSPEQIVTLFQKANSEQVYRNPRYQDLCLKMFKKIVFLVEENKLDLKSTQIFLDIFSSNFEHLLNQLEPSSLTDNFNNEMKRLEFWDHVLCYSYDPKKVGLCVAKNEIVLEDLPNISLEDLTSLMKQINYSDPKSLIYVDLEEINDDGESVDINYIEKGFTFLLNYIDKKTIFTGVPSKEKERNEWYDRLSCLLKYVIKGANETFMLPSSDEANHRKRIIAKDLVYLGVAGHHCGERWLGITKEILDSLNNQYKINFEGLEEKIVFWLQQYQEGFLEDMDRDFSNFFGIGHGPHIRNRFAKDMIKQGFTLKGQGSITLKDRLTLEEQLSSENIRTNIQQYFHPMMIIKFIYGKLQQECRDKPQFPAIALIPFKESAKKAIKDVKESQSKKRTVSQACLFDNQEEVKRQRIISSDEEVDEFIRKKGWYQMNEMMTEINFTVNGVMEVLNYLKFFKRA